jgi:hypothetical protein
VITSRKQRAALALRVSIYFITHWNESANYPEVQGVPVYNAPRPAIRLNAHQQRMLRTVGGDMRSTIDPRPATLTLSGIAIDLTTTRGLAHGRRCHRANGNK